jgi:hypothetical protein
MPKIAQASYTVRSALAARLFGLVRFAFSCVVANSRSPPPSVERAALDHRDGEASKKLANNTGIWRLLLVF